MPLSNNSSSENPRPFTFGLRGLLALVTTLACTLGVAGLTSPVWSGVFLVGAATIFTGWRSQTPIGKLFSMWHVGLFLALWLIASLLTYLALEAGLTSGDPSQLNLISMAVASITGPMTCAICRGMQGCCLECSLSLLPYSALGPGLATLFQFVIPPTNGSYRVVRLVLWLLGLVVWFGGGFLSLGHALS